MGSIFYHENVFKTFRLLRSDKSSINWMILNFPVADDANDEWLTVKVVEVGSGGPKALRKKLSHQDSQFALIKFLTHIDSRILERQIYKYVCITWIPSEHGIFSVQELATLHLRKEVTDWLNEQLGGLTTIRLTEKSKITRTTILCWLNKKGLLKGLLLRVITSKENGSTQLLYIDRHVEVRSLKERVGEEILGLNMDKIDLNAISLEIINDTTIHEESWFQNVARTFAEPPKFSKILTDKDDERTLQQVGITFGCKIYVDYDEKGCFADDIDSEWLFKQQALVLRGMRELNDMVYNADSVTLDDLHFLQMDVAKGKSASVHQALWQNKLPVAVKEFRFYKLTEKIKKEFDSEIDIIQRLSRDVSHPNVVKMVGMLRDHQEKKLFIILEWVGQGTLFNFIRGPSKYCFFDVLRMSLDIAKGMEHLHSRQVIHRDLKTHNLLLDYLLNVKVTDFGTSKVLDKTIPTFTEVGTSGYTAPEIFGPSGYSYKADVFSYGIILWELVDRGRSKNPLTGIWTNYYEKVSSGERPRISKRIQTLCPQYVSLVQDCWSFDPKKRPSFKEICMRLEDLSASKKGANIPILSEYGEGDSTEEVKSEDVHLLNVGPDSNVDVPSLEKNTINPEQVPAPIAPLPVPLPQPDAVVPIPKTVYVPSVQLGK